MFHVWRVHYVIGPDLLYYPCGIGMILPIVLPWVWNQYLCHYHVILKILNGFWAQWVIAHVCVTNHCVTLLWFYRIVSLLATWSKNANIKIWCAVKMNQAMDDCKAAMDDSPGPISPTAMGLSFPSKPEPSVDYSLIVGKVKKSQVVAAFSLGALKKTYWYLPT